MYKLLEGVELNNEARLNLLLFMLMQCLTEARHIQVDIKLSAHGAFLK